MAAPAVVPARGLAAIPRYGCGLLVAVAAVTGSARAADNPFVGTWTLDSAKSRLPDAMKFKEVGPNRYGLDFDGGGYAETIVADGTDQPGVRGTTFSISVQGPGRWKAVRKQAGKMLLTANWTLSRDGNSLDDDFIGFQPDGSVFHVDYLYRRTAGGPSLAGAWESTRETVKSPFELKIVANAGDGLAFTIPYEGATKKLSFDGSDYAYERPSVKAKFAASMRRVNAATLEVTDKVNGRPLDTQSFELSPDRKTLTVSIRYAGQSRPETLVFDRAA
jgi:hypothetical protein